MNRRFLYIDVGNKAYEIEKQLNDREFIVKLLNYRDEVGDAYNKELLTQVGKLWETMGGEWGGSWKQFVDMPHFQFTNGKSIKDLQGGYKLPEQTKMKWENK